jgi:hypothetical protein
MKEKYLGDSNAKVGTEDILKPTIGYESLHKTSTDNSIRVVNFVTSKDDVSELRRVKNMVVKRIIFHKAQFVTMQDTQ